MFNHSTLLKSAKKWLGKLPFSFNGAVNAQPIPTNITISTDNLHTILFPNHTPTKEVQDPREIAINKQDDIHKLCMKYAKTCRDSHGLLTRNHSDSTRHASSMSEKITKELSATCLNITGDGQIKFPLSLLQDIKHEGIGIYSVLKGHRNTPALPDDEVGSFLMLAEWADVQVNAIASQNPSPYRPKFLGPHGKPLALSS